MAWAEGLQLADLVAQRPIGLHAHRARVAHHQALAWKVLPETRGSSTRAGRGMFGRQGDLRRAKVAFPAGLEQFDARRSEQGPAQGLDAEAVAQLRPARPRSPGQGVPEDPTAMCLRRADQAADDLRSSRLLAGVRPPEPASQAAR
ncbi:MAG: hypothetical protein IPI03_15915 [Rubrivivax sp.]|nr:hypothetical protein [Rubrivivax sp.]